MLLALSSEGTAAILGAVAGGGIAIVGQMLFGVLGAFRARKVAAGIIYAELVGNMANARVAIDMGDWTVTKPEALRAAWDTYGARLLLPWHKPHDVGAVAVAYNRVDDIAWLATSGMIIPGDGYESHMNDIYCGLYVIGRAAGYTDRELATRNIPVGVARGQLEENRARARSSGNKAR